ncbi:MAG: ribonuclease HII [Deltaproteobacteria bacterium]|nr:ribonuclease HII [Deltaproteobacteria bacterium]
MLSKPADLEISRQKPRKVNSTKRKSLCSFRLELEFNSEITIGVDEVGRGCLAGPVVAAGVVFSKEDWKKDCDFLAAIDDSKKIRKERREELAEHILKTAQAVEISFCSPQVVDQINILQATFRACRELVQKIEKKFSKAPGVILIDGPHKIPGVSHLQHTVIGGDGISKSIAAASIVAKVYRDRLMDDMAEKFPGYGFESNKGYGTKVHTDALKRIGPCEIHRQSFLKNFQNLETGQKGEDSAAEFLNAQGFKILSQNWKTPGAEIDVIAEKNGEIHFIEVRTRTRSVEVDLAFPPSKQRQFRKAVELYRLKNPRIREKTFHLDLIFISQEKIDPFWDVFGL